MPIITVSMDDGTLETLDRLNDELGLRGRSDTVRAALRCLATEHHKMGEDKGFMEGILIVMNEESISAELDKARHLHHDVIKTQMHNHLQGGKCLQTFILSGDSEEIHELLHTMQRLKGVCYIKFIVSTPE